MKKFNLSEWALQHSALVWYFMIVFSIVGVVAYNQLGREEDPSFTIKTMIIQSQWPGASAEEVTQQVTDRIEKKLQELDNLEHTRSVTTAGKTTIFVDLKAETKAKEVKPTWLRIRNMIADIQHDFPTGVVGPFFNDNFGDVYGNIFAFSSEDMNHRQLRDLVENVRSQILTLPDTGKVDIIGAQDEVIYLEFSTRKIAALGIDKSDILATLQAQNAVTQSGFIQTNGERIALRVGGRFISEDSLRAINLQVNHRFFPLTDVATISRGYIDPPDSLFRFNGKPAIGLIVGMKTGRNLLEFGKELDAMLSKITQSLPVGVTIDRVADQPETVHKAISGFTHALFEAVAIVLAISFISLGIRAGLVVAISIPLVLAITFVIMQYADITLQRVSLGALIIALGLLVDDAMIAVEMMVARLEAGDNLRKAATYVYTSTAFPMLTGTLVTVSGFIPIGFNSSNAGEFTFTLFVVLAVSLIVSWGVAVLFTPLLGVTLLKNMPHHHVENKGRFMRVFSRIVNYCLKYRWATIATTLATFLLSIVGLAFVQQQFFPNSDRPELIIDWNLPQNSSITETSRQMLKFEKEKLAENKDIDHWSTYVGRSAPRFILSFNVQPDNAFWGQTIIVANDIEARDRLRVDLQQYLKNTFPGTDAYVSLLDIGPPVGKPVQYRISGPDIQTVRNYSRQLASIITSHPSLTNIAFDWNEPARVVKVNVLQDKLRQLGVSSESIATALNGVVEGTSVTQVLDDIYLVDVISRAEKAERGSIESIYNLQLPSSNGKSIPLSSVATFQYKLEQPVIWRWDRIPTVTIKAAINDKKQAATIIKELSDKIAAFQQTLPPGYSVTVGGSVEESAKSQAPIARVVPIMLFVMATLLMIQLQGFSRLFLVFSVAPLALIGVVIALLLSNTPLGFVALLGVLALTGILIRNSVILLVLIEELRRTGMSPWQAVVEATEHRIRPILLTAAAATLGLIPISREIFWGPMSFAMMGGIIVGTVLTLLFLPALYVTWFRIKHDA
ncbi:efflux RND transporter permease subunit [Dickeya fangzhongdai]|uniref:efflux RND transporter permease subunit n=1 Tax=Dickeya fangzhongdai TaxID=1778540 RepID=UPI001ADC7011|nr:efflux RND transporter permease subunit [Dickeya fangzhongdai]MBO8132602.1 efflux RND transporter permease subunit [Dickeya fangzhongdai]